MNMAAGLSLKPPVCSRKEKEGAPILGRTLPSCDSYCAVLGNGDIMQLASTCRIGHSDDGGR